MNCLCKLGNTSRLLLLFSAFAWCVRASGQDSVIDTQMYDNPAFTGQVITYFHRAALWLKALQPA